MTALLNKEHTQAPRTGAKHQGGSNWHFSLCMPMTKFSWAMLGFLCEILFCFVVCNCMSDYIYTHLFMHVSRPEIGCEWLSQSLFTLFLWTNVWPRTQSSQFHLDWLPWGPQSQSFLSVASFSTMLRLEVHAVTLSAWTRELRTEPHAHSPVQQQVLSQLSRAGFFLTLYCLNSCSKHSFDFENFPSFSKHSTRILYCVLSCGVTYKLLIHCNYFLGIFIYIQKLLVFVFFFEKRILSKIIIKNVHIFYISEE